MSDYEYCISDWKAWLGIDNYSSKELFPLFIIVFLMITTSQKYFTEKEIFDRPKFNRNFIT